MKIIKLSLILSLLFLFSCQQKKEGMALYPSENPKERVEWDLQRLADPNTGEIPKNIRQKELLFAKNLPKSNSFSKSFVDKG